MYLVSDSFFFYILKPLVYKSICLEGRIVPRQQKETRNDEYPMNLSTILPLFENIFRVLVTGLLTINNGGNKRSEYLVTKTCLYRHCLLTKIATFLIQQLQ